ncbi:hypothetical protein BC332_22014 [Capsicum chinense]|nr:hypothetical protein BC332_22014 [Capsicum chinense]
MNLLCLGPIPQCPSNVSSSSIPRLHIVSSSSFPRSSISSSRSTGPRKIPARDRVTDFGKYKGKMLGTLPSKYLKWVTKNLRARDVEEWANLADQVLSDPVYKDRVEWEFAQALLNGDVPAGMPNAVSKLLEISTRFGWDNDDNKTANAIGMVEDKKGVGARGDGSRQEEESEKDSRERRRKRIRLHRRNDESGSRLRHSTITETRGDSEDFCNTSSGVMETPSRFPGRESLLKKALSLGTRKNTSK